VPSIGSTHTLTGAMHVEKQSKLSGAASRDAG
jgi:hypothetical protein